MEYYVSKVHNRLNKRPFTPEKYTDKLCLNPKYNVALSRPGDEISVLLDSGAFQDLHADQRLSSAAALDRQLAYEKKVGFESRFIVSYDRIVDESPTVQGIRRKRRVGRKTSEEYVEETISAAKFLADHRKELRPRRLVLSNQGVTPEQYLGCLKEVLRFSEPKDVIGLGGFCIIGQVPRYTKDYFEVLETVLPRMKRRRIRRVHLFGIGVFKVLIRTHILCHRYGIIPSYDTASLEFNAVFGKAFKPDLLGEGPEGVHMTQVFAKRDKYELYHPRDWAHVNIQTASFFWDQLNGLYPISQERGT